MLSEVDSVFWGLDGMGRAEVGRDDLRYHVEPRQGRLRSWRLGDERGREQWF